MSLQLLRVGTVLLALCWLGCGSPEAPEQGQSRPVSPAHTLDPARVPEELRHLVPLAAEWGLGDDFERFEKIERSTSAERSALTNAIAPHQAEITAWLDSLAGDEMSDEAAAFMFMQLAVEELP